MPRDAFGEVLSARKKVVKDAPATVARSPSAKSIKPVLAQPLFHDLLYRHIVLSARVTGAIYPCSPFFAAVPTILLPR
jgi:hypothetical protein